MENKNFSDKRLNCTKMMLSENDQIISDETTTPDTLSTSLRNLNLNHQKLKKVNLHFQKY